MFSIKIYLHNTFNIIGLSEWQALQLSPEVVDLVLTYSICVMSIIVYWEIILPFFVTQM